MRMMEERKGEERESIEKNEKWKKLNEERIISKKKREEKETKNQNKKQNKFEKIDNKKKE